MSTLKLRLPIIYPETDGMPMAENTKQFRHIVTIKENLDLLYAAQEDVFVAGDLFWYPIEGEPGIRVAPDVLVVFGRPKGDRPSYLQWLEDHIAPQVVFEIWSPGNRAAELLRKLEFYDQHGVEEYYWYDPEQGDLAGYLRRSGKLEPIDVMNGWISPRLGVRFSLEGRELVLHRPDGQRFLTFGELAQKAEAAQQRAEAAQQSAQAAEQRAEAAEKEAAQLRALLQQRGPAPKP